MPSRDGHKGLHNCRDIGGYPISSHQCIQRGIVYRSASRDLTGFEERLALKKLFNIQMIFDLRNTSEKDTKSVSAGALVAPLPRVYTPDFETLVKYFSGLEENPEQAVADMYKNICDNSKEAFRAIFEYIRDNPNSPLLVHCEIGKDRTGTFIAMLLFALGASDEYIIHDYQLSQVGIEAIVEGNKEKLLSSPLMKEVSVSDVALERHFMALPGSMALFLENMRAEYGTGEAYLESIGFQAEDVEKIKSNMIREV